MKITKRQLRRVIREAMRDKWVPSGQRAATRRPSERRSTTGGYDPKVGDRVQVRGGGKMGEVVDVREELGGADIIAIVRLTTGITVERGPWDLIYRG